jgi:hypothetical protein
MMNSKYAATVSGGKILRTIVTLAGAAIGAGGGALLGGSEGSPATGALIGGFGGGTVGYIVGTEMEHNGYYGRGYYGGF